VRKKLKRFRVLIFALSVLMSFCLVYPQNDDLGEIRFLSSNLTLGRFEPADQEDLVVDSPDQSKGIVSAAFINLTLLRIYSFKHSLPFFFQPVSLKQNYFILRC